MNYLLIFFFLLLTSCDTDLESGTINNPIKITSISDLIELSNSPDEWSKHYMLTNSIDADTSKYLNDGKGFSPIGDARSDREIPGSRQGIPFSGSFNGQGFTIKNLTIERSNENYVGLFGFTTGLVRNLKLDSCTIKGKSRVGSIIGEISDPSQTQIIDSLATTNSSIEGTGYDIGGLFGYTETGQIIHCYSNTYVKGNQNVGGFVGNNSCNLIQRSFSISEVDKNREKSNCNTMGGFVGKNLGDISECFAYGPVYADYNVGGFVGSHTCYTIENCYSQGTVYGETQVTGFGVIFSDMHSWGEASSPGIIKNSYSNVVKHSGYGGPFSVDVLGSIGESPITNCYFNKNGENENDIISFSIVNYDEIQGIDENNFNKEDSFSSFDFETIWYMGEYYPLLRNMPDF